MNKEITALKRILERERKSRKASEKIIEQKSLEIYLANQKLQKLYNKLENRYLKIVEHANDIIYWGDEKGICKYVNHAAEKILGYSQSELLGKHFTELLAGSTNEIIEFYKDQIISQKESTYKEFTVKDKKGKVKWLGQNVTLFFEDDKLTGVLGIARDINFQKEAENTIKRNETKYKQVIANMRLGLLEVDTKGIVSRVYDRFCEMTGYSEHELLGRDPTFILADDNSKAIIHQKNENRKTGLSDVYEVKCRKKNGETLWMMISGSPRYDDKGDFVGSIGIHMDITEQKNLLDQLESARSAAERSSEAKQIFLANMSHEIRTPLNAVLGMTYLLQETDTTAEQSDYLNTIKHSSELLLSIISDILDVSKIELGKIEKEEAPFDLKQLLLDQCKSFQSRLSEKGITVNLNWNLQLNHFVIADQKLVNQIFTNLLGNAAKFTEAGEISIQVNRIEEHDNQLKLAFEVRDTGIGIPPEKLDSIFESFEQADQDTSVRFGGTGLGLSIAKHLIELYKGAIKVESQVGSGSCFIFDLELAIGSVIDKSNSIITEKQNETDLSNVKVLVAEDNLINQKFISKLLQKFGIQFEMSNNGQECLNKLNKEKYHCLILDMQMPIIDGYEVCQTVRSDRGGNKNIPIIALTASAMTNERDRAYECGVNEHLTKPFQPLQLKELLIKYTKNDQSEKDLFFIDESYLFDLYQGDLEFEADMIQTFLKNFDTDLDQLILSSQESKLKEVSELAHKMKPTFKMVGLKNLETYFSAIESLALEEDKSILEKVGVIQSSKKQIQEVLMERLQHLNQ